VSGAGGVQGPATGITIAEALAEARAAGVARLDAQQLLAHLLQRPRTWVLAHDDAPLAQSQAAGYRALIARRAAGEPFAYLVGEREFHGLTLRVTPAVLVPRPDTETLVDWAIELLCGTLSATDRPEVLDLGTGSGAIALAVQRACPQAAVAALDASAEALAVARDNAARLGLAVELFASDWWSATGARRWHLALSNPPYIAEDDPHLADLGHEPQLALTPGGDGLAAYNPLIAGAPAHLHPDGWLLFEHGAHQAAAVRAKLHHAGFVDVQTRRDLEDRERCTGGRWPGATNAAAHPRES
jgi:release factor glutamine methyltransferase